MKPQGFSKRRLWKILTKKEVSAFLGRMEAQAHAAVRESYEAAVKAEEQRIFDNSKAAGIIEGMQSVVDTLTKSNEALNDELENNPEMNYYGSSYSGLTHYLSRIDDIKAIVLERIEFESRELSRLETEFEETQRKITANYAAIRADLKNKSKAAQCVEYLREVGFDVSELEKLECTAVAVALDKRYLFIGIKKEENR